MKPPLLPAGFNSWQNNGDDVDGPGANEPVWPVYFVSLTTLDPLIITQDMLDIFTKGCADFTPCQDLWEVVLPREMRELIIGRAA